MAIASADFTEKRDFKRLSINSPVTISLGNKDYTGICKDLSGTGMLIETEDNFTIGTEMVVTIKQESEKSLPFNANVEVIRVNTSTESKHTIGLAIKEILD